MRGVIDQRLISWECKKTEVVAELWKSLYVDDLVSGKPTAEQAQEMKKNAIEIFDDAKFILHKWHSNNRKLEDNSSGDEEMPFAKQQLGTSSQGDGSLLGITWSKEEDNIKVCAPSSEVTITKRRILSNFSQIYDPLGLLSPRTLQGKMIYREVCEEKAAWDALLGCYLLGKEIRG